MNLHPIAYFHSPFSSKFGIPKQSGLVAQLPGEIVFEPEYRNVDLLRGIDGFEYIWLIWEFSANREKKHSSLVRPPLLGGNKKVGIFASRSPFRPNPIGLSSVRISSVELNTPRGPVVKVLGADLMDGTPIYDIKPYLEYADSHRNVKCGFIDNHPIAKLKVEIPPSIAANFSTSDLQVLRDVLALNPSPAYQKDTKKIYGMPFLEFDIKFKIEGEYLYVLEVNRLNI